MTVKLPTAEQILNRMQRLTALHVLERGAYLSTRIDQQEVPNRDNPILVASRITGQLCEGTNACAIGSFFVAARHLPGRLGDHTLRTEHAHADPERKRAFDALEKASRPIWEEMLRLIRADEHPNARENADFDGYFESLFEDSVRLEDTNGWDPETLMTRVIADARKLLR